MSKLNKYLRAVEAKHEKEICKIADKVVELITDPDLKNFECVKSYLSEDPIVAPTERAMITVIDCKFRNNVSLVVELSNDGLLAFPPSWYCYPEIAGRIGAAISKRIKIDPYCHIHNCITVENYGVYGSLRITLRHLNLVDNFVNHPELIIPLDGSEISGDLAEQLSQQYPGTKLSTEPVTRHTTDSFVTLTNGERMTETEYRARLRRGSRMDAADGNDAIGTSKVDNKPEKES